MPSDLVRRAKGKVFHLKCFTCIVCRKQISTGEELYVFEDNKFMCKEDYLSTKNIQLQSPSQGQDGSHPQPRAQPNMAPVASPLCGAQPMTPATLVPNGASLPTDMDPLPATAATGARSEGTGGPTKPSPCHIDGELYSWGALPLWFQFHLRTTRRIGCGGQTLKVKQASLCENRKWKKTGGDNAERRRSDGTRMPREKEA